MTTLDVPNSERFVVATRNDTAAIKAERDGVHPIRVSLEDFEALTTHDIPNSKRAVIATRDDTATIRADDSRYYPIGMALEYFQALAFL
jgi:hypothetical protein